MTVPQPTCWPPSTTPRQASDWPQNGRFWRPLTGRVKRRLLDWPNWTAQRCVYVARLFAQTDPNRLPTIKPARSRTDQKWVALWRANYWNRVVPISLTGADKTRLI